MNGQRLRAIQWWRGGALDGGGGGDGLDGGADGDLYIVRDSGDAVIDSAAAGAAGGAGGDTVEASVTYDLADDSGIEVLRLTGDDAHDHRRQPANLIIGNTAANVLNGDGGVDTLSGGGGDTYVLDGDDRVTEC